MSRTVLLMGVLGLANAFSPTSLPMLKSRGVTATTTTNLRMVAISPKVGTGSNGMNDDGFTKPLVQRVELPDDSWSKYEYRVIEEAVNVKKLNAAEKLKLKKVGMRIIDDIQALADEAKAKGGAQFMDPDDVNIRLKWLGLFHRPAQAPGTFMWRLRIHNGQATSEQWRVCAEQIEEYDTGSRDLWDQMGCADVTSRQNIQLRGIRLENLPRHWKALTDAGMISVQAGMDNVRNLVGNPLAGIDPEEIIDTRPYCKEFTDKLTNYGKGSPEFSNLPRKFNVCYVGSKEMFEHPDINDIAYMPTKDAAGNMGWNIEVGGLLMSTRCEFALPMNAWVPLDKHWAVGEAILTTFRDFGNRYNPRTKCRLMFLIDNMGMDLFREEVAKRYKESTGEELGFAEANHLVPKEWKRRELLGANKQKDGKNWIGMVIPAGRMYADEMKAIAKMADDFGSGNIRMTVEGNVLVIDIPDEKLDGALAASAAIQRLELAPKPLMKGTVACAGNQFCGQSKINTKGYAVKFAQLLDEKFDFPEGKDVRVHWTGCPNTCAQIQLGDIGLLGTTCKDSAGQLVEGVDIYLGGGIGQDASIGELYKSKVPIDERLEEELSEILVSKLGATPKKAKLFGMFEMPF